MTASGTSNGIYRTPGRVPEAERMARPPWLLLLSPLASAAAAVLAIGLPVLLFDALRMIVLRTSGDTRFVPAVDLTLDLLALALLASPVWLGLMIAGRIAPYWSALRPWGRVSYVAMLFALELLVLVTAQASIVARRAGMHLFEPTLARTSLAPDGRRAHVYRGGLVECRYDVYVARPFALTMKRQLTVGVQGCTEPTPHVRWSADRSVELVDQADRVIPKTVRPPPR
jgi:hypothetical protein